MIKTVQMVVTVRGCGHTEEVSAKEHAECVSDLVEFALKEYFDPMKPDDIEVMPISAFEES